MNNQVKLYLAQMKLANTFRAIKDNPLDLNRIMTHVGQVSEAVDTLISEVVDKDLFFKLHVEMLARTPAGYNRPQVAVPQHWRNLGRVVKAGDQINLAEIHPDQLYFWSDQHFGHKHIIEFSQRPFGNLDHMHMDMAERFKKVTMPGDVVIWCGDVSFMGTTALAEIMKDYSHTYNILVVGNHDIERDGKMRSRLVDHFDEVHTSLVFDNFIVTHHPWVDSLPKGMINIHGHMHDRPFAYDNHVCACVELINYAPASLAYLLSKMRHEMNKRSTK